MAYAYELITKKRFNNKVLKVLKYLEKHWGTKVAEEFSEILIQRLINLTEEPYIGAQIEDSLDIRSFGITKHNRLYYKIRSNKLIILNMYDTRINPKRNIYKNA